MKRLLPIVCVLAASSVSLGCVAVQANDRVKPVPAAAPPVTGEAPVDLLVRIRGDLATRTGRDTGALKPVRDETVTWSDGALGCPRFGEVYTQETTRGYWVVYALDGRNYDYRVDARGRFRLCENPRGSGKAPLSDR